MSIRDIPDELWTEIIHRLPDLQSAAKFNLISQRFHRLLTDDVIFKKLTKRLLYTERIFVLREHVFAQCSNGQWACASVHHLHCYRRPDEMLPQVAFLPTRVFDGIGKVTHITGGIFDYACFTEDGAMYFPGKVYDIWETPKKIPRAFPSAKCVKPFHVDSGVEFGVVADGAVYLSFDGLFDRPGSRDSLAVGDFKTVIGDTWNLFYHERSHGFFRIFSRDRTETVDLLNTLQPDVMKSNWSHHLFGQKGGRWYGDNFRDMMPELFGDTQDIPEGIIHIPTLDGAVDVENGYWHLLAIFQGDPRVYSVGIDIGQASAKRGPFSALPLETSVVMMGCTEWNAWILTEDHRIWCFRSIRDVMVSDGPSIEVFDLDWYSMSQ